MLAFIIQTFRARWRVWLPAVSVVTLVATLVGVSVLHYWTSTTPEMAAAVAEAGTTLSEVRIAAGTMYVLTALFGAIALNVVGAATVEAERTLMAQWRLAGALPRQTSAMAIGMVAVTALAGAIPGVVVAALAGPSLVRLVNSMAGPNIEAVPVTMAVAPAVLTIGLTVGTCLLGTISPARRAGKVPPVEAIVSSGPRRARLTAWRIILTVIGVGATVLIAIAALRMPTSSNGPVTMAFYLGLSLILTFHAAAPILIPALMKAWGRLLTLIPGPALQIARHSAVARAQISTATVSPLAAGLGCVGALVGAASTFRVQLESVGVTEVNMLDSWIIVVIATVMLTGCSVAVGRPDLTQPGTRIRSPSGIWCHTGNPGPRRPGRSLALRGHGPHPRLVCHPRYGLHVGLGRPPCRIAVRAPVPMAASHSICSWRLPRHSHSDRTSGPQSHHRIPSHLAQPRMSDRRHSQVGDNSTAPKQA